MLDLSVTLLSRECVQRRSWLQLRLRSWKYFYRKPLNISLSSLDSFQAFYASEHTDFTSMRLHYNADQLQMRAGILKEPPHVRKSRVKVVAVLRKGELTKDESPKVKAPTWGKGNDDLLWLFLPNKRRASSCDGRIPANKIVGSEQAPSSFCLVQIEPFIVILYVWLSPSHKGLVPTRTRTCQKHKGRLGISGDTTSHSFTVEFGKRLNSILVYIMRIFSYFYLNVQLSFLGHLIGIQQAQPSRSSTFFSSLNTSHTLSVSYCSPFNIGCSVMSFCEADNLLKL